MQELWGGSRVRLGQWWQVQYEREVEGVEEAATEELVALAVSFSIRGVRLAGVRSSTRQLPCRDHSLREASSRGTSA